MPTTMHPQRFLVATLAAALTLAPTLTGQATPIDCAAIRRQAQSNPSDAMAQVEAALAAGADTFELHLLHAELLLGAQRIAAVDDAIACALNALDRDRRQALDLQARAKAATAAPTAPTAAAPQAVDTPEQAWHAVDARIGQGDVAGAAGLLLAIARSGPADDRGRARDRLTDVVKTMAADVAHRADTDPAGAAALVDQVLAFADALRGDLDDSDRALDATEPLLGTKDPAIVAKVDETMLRWHHDEIVASDAATDTGDQNAQTAAARKQAKISNRLRGPQAKAKAFGEGLRQKNAAARRRQIENCVAWAKAQYLMYLAALKAHDQATADLHLNLVKTIVVELQGQGEDEAASELTNDLADSGVPGVAEQARAAAVQHADARVDQAKQHLQGGDPNAAADALAGAFVTDPSRAAIGRQAVELLLEAERRFAAYKLLHRLARCADESIAATARAQLASLQTWAKESFTAIAPAFARSLNAHRPAEAIGMAYDQLRITDDQKVRAIEDALASGLDPSDQLRDLGKQLAAGEFASDGPTGPIGDAGLLRRPPEIGEPFAASMGIRLMPIAPGEVTLADGRRIQVTQPFWAAELRLTPEQLGSYNNNCSFGNGLVSWNNAVMFCLYLTRKEREAGRLPLGYAYTLPTLAEWRLMHERPTQATAAEPDADELCLDVADKEPAPGDPPLRIIVNSAPGHALQAKKPYLDTAHARPVLAPRPELDPPYKH